MLEMLTIRRPYRLTLSVYGATEASYDGLTRRRGAFKAFTKGLSAAHEAGLSINLNLVVTRHVDPHGRASICKVGRADARITPVGP